MRPLHGRRRGQGSPGRRLKRREHDLKRRERRELQAALADVGEALRLVRDGELYRAEGFATFDDWCALRWADLCPASWHLSAPRVAELVELAIAAAEDRRQAANL